MNNGPKDEMFESHVEIVGEGPEFLGVGRGWGRNLHWELKSVFLPVRERVWIKCVSVSSLMCLLYLVVFKEFDEWEMVHMPGS